jgi:hypothetical protein
MKTTRTLRTVLAAALLPLAGCTPGPSPLAEGLDDLFNLLARADVPGFALHSQGQSLLVLALQQYEDGKYREAEVSLTAALDRGLAPHERVVAHKHLAFIHCAAERRPQCRYEFVNALRADPAMRLEPAESGHPVWGPVFASLKSPR